MQIKLRYYLLFICFVLAFNLRAQDNKLKNLAQLYSQGHYKLVYRKAGILQSNPDYDHSKEPAKYRQLAALELSKNKRWLRRHPQKKEQTQEVQTLQLLNEAKKYLGVPYQFAGADPMGFDCSGFTYFIFEKSGVQMPRRAVEQYEWCQKIDKDEAFAGDLVFFSNGGEINHVGLLISQKGAPQQMIHSSLSLGISIVELQSNPYWQPKIVGYGRVILH